MLKIKLKEKNSLYKLFFYKNNITKVPTIKQ